MRILSPFSNILTIKNIIVITLLTAIIFSAIDLILLRHKNRLLFNELAQLQYKRDHLHITWSQLLLEKGTLSSGIKVEKIAAQKLKMNLPEGQENT